MSKLLTLLTAGSLALTLSGFATAQNQSGDPPAGGAPAAEPAVPAEKGSPSDPAAGGATATKSEQEYLSSLKNCEPLTGAEKDSCVEAAKKKHGQM